MLIRLFSIAFPDEWNWNDFYTSDGQIREGATSAVFTTVPAGRNWASLPDAISRLTGWYTRRETEIFIRDIGSLFGGLRFRTEETGGWAAVRGGRARNLSVFIGPEGLPAEYRGTDRTGNVHHWAWSLNLGYYRGRPVGERINETRELQSVGWDRQEYLSNPNSQADVALGNIGVAMGAYMNDGWFWGNRPPYGIRQAWELMPLTVSAQ